MAASTQGDRLIREPPWNISCKAGFALFAVIGSIIAVTAVI
jgi:hypothetical protein